MCVGGCWMPIDPDAGVGCDYNGTPYGPGSSFRAGDGCNTCTCFGGEDAGTVACTKRDCACNPTMEAQQRAYVGTSAQSCATIRYTCPQHTTPFSNDCGCGCEQDVACPDWFDCSPTPGAMACDPVALKTMCPYSGIAY